MTTPRRIPTSTWVTQVPITHVPLPQLTGESAPARHTPASTWVTQVPIVTRDAASPRDAAAREPAALDAPVIVGPGAPATAPTPALVRSVTRSIHASGLWKTAAGRAYEAALRRDAAALRSYLAVRLRGHVRGRDAFEMVREALDEGHGTELFATPGARARLFLLARRIVQLCDDLDPVVAPIEEAPWDSAPLGSPRGYGLMLDRVRRAASDSELERLELSLAYGLEDPEVAYVLEEPLESCRSQRSATLAWLRMQLEDEPLARGVEVEAIVRDALRVLPLPVGDTLELDAIPAPLAVGTVVGDRFAIEECVGGGAFGHVYRARDVRVPTHVVALKMLHREAKTPAAREGAISELSRIASAFHPNLVQLKEHGWYLERLWFVMPWYRGETLAVRLEREPLGVAEAARLLAPIARALAALHENGIRHQDVKPDNILLAELAGQTELLPVLLDLGVAARSEDLAVAGTPMYFAPEMARRILEPEGEAAISAKADVFALAMTLLHALVPPEMSEPDFDEFMRERAIGAPPLPRARALGPVRRTLTRWLSTDPALRPSAAELGEELERLGRAVAPRRGLRALAIAAGVAVVVAAATVAALGAGVGPASWPAWASGSVALEAPAAAEAPARRSHADAAALHALRERLQAAETRAAELEARLTASDQAADPSVLDPGAPSSGAPSSGAVE